MKTEKAIKHFGTKANLAKELGITRGAIQFWGENVPLGRAYQIEKITGGKVKVDNDPLFNKAS